MAEVAVDRKLLIAGVLVALATGTFLGFFLDREVSSEPDVVDRAPRSAGPTDQLNGVPVGYARTEEGAIVAATNYALVPSSDLVADREALIQAAETFAAPGWEETAREQAERGFDFASESYGSDFQITTSVIRYRLLSFSVDRARVQLWTVSLAAGSKKSVAESVWGTSRIDLQWVDGDWRVQNTENESGPAPVALPGPDNATQSFMEEFSEFSEGPRP